MKVGSIIVALLVLLVILAGFFLPKGWGSRLLETEKMKQERISKERDTKSKEDSS